MKRIIYLCIFLSIYNLSFAQEWQTITSVNDVRDIVATDTHIWAATEGGVFSYNISDESVERYTNIEGMKSILIYAIEADDNGQIICGGEKGILEVFDISSQTWMQEYSLEGYPIKDILVRNDSLWAIAEEGVALFLWKDYAYVFNDYFINFTTLPGEVNAVEVFNGYVWIATDIGVLYAEKNQVLNNPQNWKFKTTSNGLPSNEVYSLSEFAGQLYIGTAGGLARISRADVIEELNGWSSVSSSVQVKSLIASAQKLFLSNGSTFFQFDLNTFTMIKSFTSTINNLSCDNSGNAWVSLAGEGIYKEGWDTFLKQDGPAFNNYRNVFQSSDGKIWALSGNTIGITEKGYYVYDGEQWKSYLYKGYAWTYLYGSYAIHEDNYNNVWIGAWGGGLLVYTNDELPSFFHNYQYENPYQYVTTMTGVDTISLSNANVYSGFLSGIPEADYFEVITAVKEDRQGRLWVANFWAGSENYLAVAPYTNDGFVSTDVDDWVYFGYSDGIATSSTNKGQIRCIEFDTYGRVWIGTNKDGIYVLDYNNTLSNKSDDEVYHITQSEDDLASSIINSIQADDDGMVWIATSSGLNSYDGVNMYTHVGDSEGKDGPLENNINQIFVDENNNKWFATTGGLSILPAENSPWDEGSWVGYTTEDGLVSDYVYSVYKAPGSSQAIIGTNRGLSIFKGSYSEIKESYDDVIGGPNPFKLGEGSGTYTIKNLMQNSTVKIFTLNGLLIRKLQNSGDGIEGSRAIWDGRDENGVEVSSGIYLYSAYTIEGKFVSGKIAVIRK